jgi:hypothetical protein
VTYFTGRGRAEGGFEARLKDVEDDRKKQGGPLSTAAPLNDFASSAV